MSRTLNKLDLLVNELVEEKRLTEEEALIILSAAAAFVMSFDKASPATMMVMTQAGITREALTKLLHPL